MTEDTEVAVPWVVPAPERPVAIDVPREVRAVASSLKVLLAQVLEIAVPVTTGFPLAAMVNVPLE